MKQRHVYLALLVLTLPATLPAQTADPLFEIRSYDAANGWTNVLAGPYPAEDVVAVGVAAVDVDPPDGLPELLVYAGSAITWYGFPVATTGPLSPTPPVAVSALVGIDVGWSPREDLVLASGSDLWVLDLDTPAGGWLGPVPQTFIPTSLAAADVVGGPARDLIASDGASIFALDLRVAPLAWVTLAAPPGPPDAVVGEDLWNQTVAERRLVTSVGGTSWVYNVATASWTLPDTRRFALGSSAPLGFGNVVVPRPLATSPIRLVASEATAGIGAIYEPGGDLHCPGIVFTDLDGDDDPDLYLVRGAGSSQGTRNSLWRNDGNGTFSPVAFADGADDPGDGAGAIAADFTGDGIRDLFVINATGPNALYRRTATNYRDVTVQTDPTPGDPINDTQEGLGVGCDNGETAPSCTLDATLAAAAGDFNRDGWLDLYLGNHQCCVPAFSVGERDVLYISNGLDANGDVTFTDVTYTAGIEQLVPPFGDSSSQAVLVADFNNDRWPDIYVTGKSIGPTWDQLFLNDGDRDNDLRWDGTFTSWFMARWLEDPANLPLGNVTCEAMGLDAADYDNDGDLDVFLTDISKGCFLAGMVTDMDLYRNRLTEDGVFSLEIVDPNPVPAPSWAWGTSWSDFDNDGDQDLHVSSHVGQLNWLYRNDNGGAAFADVTIDSGASLAWNSRSSVPADYDGDGRTDLLVAHRDLDGTSVAPSLLRNNTPLGAGNHWLKIRLVGDPTLAPGPFLSTLDAVGARIEVSDGATTQRRDVFAGGHSCASTRDYIAHFGVGAATSVDVTVYWPSGRDTNLTGQAVDRLLVIREQ